MTEVDIEFLSRSTDYLETKSVVLEGIMLTETYLN